MPISLDSFARVTALALVLMGTGVSDALGADATVRIPLDAKNGLGESGVAILTAHGAQTLVELQMKGGPGDPQPAHFHTGTCDNYTPRPLDPLRAVIKGASSTMLDVPLEKLVGGDLVINVHKSFSDIATIASCAVSKR